MSHLFDQVLDRFLAPGKGEVIHGFAGPFTLAIIADLLGVPDEDRPAFAEGIQHRPQGGGVGGTGEAMAKSPLEFLYEKFTRYVEERRADPRDDVLTGMAHATFPDGSTPEPIEVARVAANVFSAGQETTVRLLGAALQKLAEDPELQQRIRADRSLIANFIEESLRIDSPITGDFRLSRVPVTVGGVDIPAGTTMMLINGSANRDPRHFDDPTTFDVERANARQHLSFGRGIHTCPGAPLARAEARVALERILDRTTDIRIDESAHGPADARRFQYAPSFILRGLIQLHLEFDLTETAP
jgi:cytochrome P450 family 150 subfamily A5